MPDVHEMFFQVFDKGQMEDGTVRRIDFTNTLIILTSSVGTDLINGLSRDPHYRQNPAESPAQSRPVSSTAFPPALLGRIVTRPYFPPSDEMLAGSARSHPARLVPRGRARPPTKPTYDHPRVGEPAA